MTLAFSYPTGSPTEDLLLGKVRAGKNKIQAALKKAKAVEPLRGI